MWPNIHVKLNNAIACISATNFLFCQKCLRLQEVASKNRIPTVNWHSYAYYEFILRAVSFVHMESYHLPKLALQARVHAHRVNLEFHNLMDVSE